MTIAVIHAEQIAVSSALHFLREGRSREMPWGRVEALAGELRHALELLSRSHPPRIRHAEARVADWHKLVAPTIGAAPGWWN